MDWILILLSLTVLGFFVFKKFSHKKRKEVLTPLSLVDTLRYSLKFGADFDSQLKSLEESLLLADAGVEATTFLMTELLKSRNASSIKEQLALLLEKCLAPASPWIPPSPQNSKMPFVIYLVGVNGVGKTTTVAKLAKYFVKLGLSVSLIAADTFRAAACEQLELWARKLNVTFFGNSQAKDPSAVIVEGLKFSKDADVVLIDTAGRLHNKNQLLSELQKMTRMCQKEYNKSPDEVWLVLDAMTGQNGLNQARVFLQSVGVSGLVLSKYDATAKGGILLAICKETKIPVRFLGVGEKEDDLLPFDPVEFTKKLLETP